MLNLFNSSYITHRTIEGHHSAIYIKPKTNKLIIRDYLPNTSHTNKEQKLPSLPEMKHIKTPEAFRNNLADLIQNKGYQFNIRHTPIIYQPSSQQNKAALLPIKETIKTLKIGVPKLAMKKNEDMTKAKAYIKTGEHREKQKNYEEAVIAYASALRCSHSSEVYAHLPPIYEKQGKTKKAAVAYIQLAQYQYQEKNGDGLSALIKASSLLPKSQTLSKLLAQGYLFKGQLDKAKEIYKVFGEDKKNTIELYNNALKFHPENTSLYEGLAAQYTSNIGTANVYLRAAHHFLYQDTTLAIQYCDLAEKLCPKQPSVYLPRLELLQIEKNTKGLVELYRKLISLFEGQKAIKQARACYKKLIQLAPKNEYFEYIINSYTNTDETRRACKWYVNYLSYLIEKKLWNKAKATVKEARLFALDYDQKSVLPILEKMDIIYTEVGDAKLEMILMELAENYIIENMNEKATPLCKRTWNQFANPDAGLVLAKLTEASDTKLSVEVYYALAQQSLDNKNLQEAKDFVKTIRTLDVNKKYLQPLQINALANQIKILNLTDKVKTMGSSILLFATQFEQMQKRMNELENQLTTYSQMPEQMQKMQSKITRLESKIFKKRRK